MWAKMDAADPRLGSFRIIADIQDNQFIVLAVKGVTQQRL